MSLSKSKSKLFKSAAVKKTGPTHYDKACVEDVLKKLKSHPEYKNKSKLKELATTLCDTESLRTYFSDFLDITGNCVLALNPALSVNDGNESEASDTDGAEALTINRVNGGNSAAATVELASIPQHIKAVASSFPVKLFLTPLPCDATVTNGNSVASMLEVKFGPMHASLQIGSVMIEWTTSDLVIPHQNIPTEPLIKTDMTRHIGIAPELQQKAREYKGQERRSITGEIDLLYKMSESINSVISSVVQVIATYNRFYYYHPYSRNSQHFVQTVMAKMGIEELPVFSTSLDAYINELKTGTTTQTNFESHAKLDYYVKQRINELETREMEYLLTEYYRIHLASRTESVLTDSLQEQWRCQEAECQMPLLEERISGRELLITSI